MVAICSGSLWFALGPGWSGATSNRSSGQPPSVRPMSEHLWTAICSGSLWFALGPGRPGATSNRLPGQPPSGRFMSEHLWIAICSGSLWFAPRPGCRTKVKAKVASLGAVFCLDLFAVHSQGSLSESSARGTKYKWQSSLQDKRGMRVVGGEGPPPKKAMPCGHLSRCLWGTLWPDLIPRC